MYDYLVVGSGLYGAIFAHEAKAHGKSVLVVDKRPNIAGNIYTENIEGINVHKYGCNLVRRTEKGRLRRRGWGLRWEKAQKGGKGTNLRGFFED